MLRAAVGEQESTEKKVESVSIKSVEVVENIKGEDVKDVLKDSAVDMRNIKAMFLLLGLSSYPPVHREEHGRGN